MIKYRLLFCFCIYCQARKLKKLNEAKYKSPTKAQERSEISVGRKTSNKENTIKHNPTKRSKAMKKNKDTGLRDLRDIVLIIVAILLIATMIHYDKDRGLHLGLPIIIEHSPCECSTDTSEASANASTTTPSTTNATNATTPKR
ncbi:hypothetical protein CQA40_04250 [Helicobacter sp. MIT 01-3238]|nr:hypothetical protein CQA40_04250 [Helicobacter sp. MIT 01-3238]